MAFPLPDDFPFRPDQPFTRAQAHEAGVPDWRLHQLVRQHVLRRPVRNLYVAASATDSLQLRCRALGLVVPADGFVCDLTAAWLHAGEKALAPGDHEKVPPISFFRPSGGHPLRNHLTRSGVRRIEPHELVEVHGLVVTTPLRTALDGGRLLGTADRRLWQMSCMLATGTFTHEQLRLEVDRFTGQRGVVLQRELVPRVDAGLGSFGEAALLNRWWDAGLPPPQTQVEIELDDGSSYFLDLGLPDVRFAAEYAGRAWHLSDEQRQRDRGRRQWIREHRAWRIESYPEASAVGPAREATRLLRDAFSAHRD